MSFGKILIHCCWDHEYLVRKKKIEKERLTGVFLEIKKQNYVD